MFMNKTIKIAKKVASQQTLTIKELLQKDVDVDIIYHSNNDFELNFQGKVKLTPQGVARWSQNGVLDVKVILMGNEAIIQDVLNNQQIQDVCSLFNTISGHVNKNTYNKYVEK